MQIISSIGDCLHGYFGVGTPTVVAKEHNLEHKHIIRNISTNV
jgi:hypothetical protein